MTEFPEDLLVRIEQRAGELRRLLDTRKQIAGQIAAMDMWKEATVQVTVMLTGAASAFNIRVPVGVLRLQQQEYLDALNKRLMQLGEIPCFTDAPPPPWTPQREATITNIPITTKDVTNG